MRILFIFFIFYTLNLYAEQRYELNRGISLLDQRSNRTFDILPEQNLQFEIVGEGSWFYRLRVFNADGSEREGQFVSAKSNIDNGFVYATLLDDFANAAEAVAQTGDSLSAGECPPSTERTPPPSDETINASVREDCQIPGTDAAWQAKCEQLYASNIPEEALNYALKVMKLNATSFRTNKCFDTQGLKPSGHPSMMGMTGDRLENNLLANGLPNKCQMVINDTDDRSPSSGGDNCRGRMYYIDLCQGSDAVVVEDYFNLGTGTCRNGRNGFRNGDGLHTTVKGAFFTHNETFDFTNTTTQTAQYRQVASQVARAGGERQATAIHLFGLQNTNNLASVTGKYMHVSPHRSSWGCPSVDPNNYYMIEALANSGPSLVLNWGREGMEEIETCTE
ncbi:MAG: hypothetical protein K9K67_00420 [Bacteriovoracaceae bacterium]|nr:hypothetical protein [Bacteriovoracaceae bacterium]